MEGERVRLHTDKEKQVHSQKQTMNFMTVTPTPPRLTFQIPVIGEDEFPKVRHVHVTDRQRAVQAKGV